MKAFRRARSGVSVLGSRSLSPSSHCLGLGFSFSLESLPHVFADRDPNRFVFSGDVNFDRLVPHDDCSFHTPCAFRSLLRFKTRSAACRHVRDHAHGIR
jgi:hypothetical protein